MYLISFVREISIVQLQVGAGEVAFLSLASSWIVVHHNMIVEVDFLDVHIVLLVLVMARGRLSFLFGHLFVAFGFVHFGNYALVLLSYLFTTG